MSKQQKSVRIDHCFITNCISFVMVTLIYTLLGELHVCSRITSQHIFIFFGMTTAVMFMMMLTDRIPTSYNSIIMGMQILDIFIVVCVTNWIFQLLGLPMLFLWTLPNILFIFIFNIIVYFAVFGVNMLKYKKVQKQINEKLRQNRELSEKEW